jgi:hypothetical protein
MFCLVLLLVLIYATSTDPDRHQCLNHERLAVSEDGHAAFVWLAQLKP